MKNEILQYILEKPEPEVQGSLDGLCGVYSIVNAFNVLNIDGFDDSECFKVALQAIKNKLPTAIWNGTFINDIEHMVDAVATWVEKTYKEDIVWDRPFEKTKFKNGEEYLEALNKIIDDYSVAIIGIEKPYEHWTVAWQTTEKEIKFFDSDGLTLVHKSDFAKPGKKRWKVDSTETLVIKKA